MPSPSTSVCTAVSDPPRAGRWINHVGAFLGLASAGLVLAGCGLPWSSTPAADTPEVRPSELHEADGRPCPMKLPIGDDPSGHGFGTEAVAEELPTLLEPQQGWVCQYETFDAGTTTSGGAIYGWGRAGQPEPVAPTDLSDLQDALDDLSLADRSRACTDDLGPRWMVVYSHDGDLTGIVVDDYGCHDVRLTDNPWTTPPGAGNQDGTVRGILNGGAAILDALDVARQN
jgi:hypothetical protein